MSIPVQRTSDVMKIGNELTAEQADALRRASTSTNLIFDHLDALNEEIAELEEPQHVPAKAATTRPTGRDLRKMNASAPQQRPTRAAAVEERVAQATGEKTFEQELAEIEDAVNTVDSNQGDGQSFKEQILDLLQNTKDSPSQQQIDHWKKQLGEHSVHCMALGEGDVYIFTHLKRGQWQKIQEVIGKIQAAGAENAEEQLKEKVVQYCTLWPKPLPVEFFYNSRAGVVDSLYQVILLNSYFLSPQQAMMLTTSL